MHSSDQSATSSSFAAYGQNPPFAQVELPASFQSFIGQTSGTQQEDDQFEYEFETDSEDELDHTLYDDDGGRLVDDNGETLIPFDPDVVYDEDTAVFLTVWAGSYREVRGRLQATRKGRDQKVVRKPKGGGKGKSKFSVKKKFFKPGQQPRRAFPDKKTPFKDKVHGKSHMGHSSPILCENCMLALRKARSHQ